MAAFQFLKLDQTLLELRAKTSAKRTAPHPSNYFHTQYFSQQQHFGSPEPPNDFTYGLNGREHVRNLIIRHLKDDLLLFVSLMHKGDVVCL